MATAAAWLVVAVALGAWFAAGSASRGSGPAVGLGGALSAGSITHAHSLHDDHTNLHDDAVATETHELTIDQLAAMTDIEQLDTIYATAADAEEQSIVVCRMLEVDVRLGTLKAIELLGEDPPLLFRMTIVDKLEEVTGQKVFYDIDQPFAAPSNQEAVAGLANILEVKH